MSIITAVLRLNCNGRFTFSQRPNTYLAYKQCLTFIKDNQWRGESEAAGEAARLVVPPPPPQSYFFCLLVWDACHVVGTTCNDRRSLRNTFGWMGAGGPGGSLAGSSKESGPKSGSNIAQQYVDGYAFFMCIAVQSHRKIPKVQSFQFSSFLSEKKMCMLYSCSRIIFLKFKRQAI